MPGWIWELQWYIIALSTVARTTLCCTALRAGMGKWGCDRQEEIHLNSSTMYMWWQWGMLKRDWKSTAGARVYFTSIRFVCFKALKFIMETTKDSNHTSCKWPICNPGAPSSCRQPREAIEETRYKWDPLWGMDAEEIEAFATTWIYPCHFRLGVGGGLLITLLSLRLMRTDESELDGRIQKSHIICQATPFIHLILYGFSLRWALQ